MELESAAAGEDLVVARSAGADSRGFVPENWYVADTGAARGCIGEVLVEAAGTTLVSSSPGLARLLFAGFPTDATVTGLVRTALPEALDWICGCEATGLEGWSTSQKRAAMELESAAAGED